MNEIVNINIDLSLYLLRQQLPTLPNGSEMWTTAQQKIKRIKTAEMKFLMGCSRLHKEGPSKQYLNLSSKG
jgi:hypothetical protein